MRTLLFAGLLVMMANTGCHQANKSASKDTLVDTTLTTDSIFNLVEKQTFGYFWDGAEPHSGLARERYHVDGDYPEHDQNVVTTGGSGFGIMSILVGIERGYITRQQGFERLAHIADFLEKADRFHGAWPHWMYGETGKVKPFGQKDNGGDLVETAFMMQGMLCVRQYFANGNEQEKALAAKINKLWEGVEWSWYRNGKNVLYWHWSPTYEWQMNFAVTGYNECLIMYVLAASSPSYSIPAEVYHEGWAKDGKIRDSVNAYGYTLKLHHNYARELGGPLFWAHYSYLALDPHGLKDKYADYWEHNVNQVLIDRAWCLENPKHFKGYGPDSWGLTASYSVNGYAAHAPGKETDLGVISPTAALSSMPYTPEYSKQAMVHWYKNYNGKLFGKYGFYDAFSETDNWYPQKYLAIDQGPEVVMMENYRSGLLWKLFMSCPEVQGGLKKLGFESPYIK
ncbi:glucoamylase family protein [Chitinophaga sancti]|uniref:Glucoamylase family protein n=2 Tax=Chitinophaga sancti TaxID=1004 RepID=A0ABZ0XRQ5_9BACT|nr:glucoamylase family protein [Chitinophaga sancti]WQD61376.1 glucoamylase family protein [Chitinophaga sancti]WQG93071.1 glucoamylase family protein [Chitinophaga sancti]